MSDGTQAVPARRWRRIPVVAWLPPYQLRWLRGDVVAGAVVAALAIPQALGYATIAGAPVQVGLYAVPVALVAYAIFGSSRQLVVGPVSTVSVLSGSFLASFGIAGTAQAASYTAALALGSGLVLIIGGFVGIGWMAEFLSKPIVTGFILGLTILVILGEIPGLLGVPTPKGRVVERVGALGGALTRGDADLATVIVSAVALLVLFGGQRLAPRAPWGLVVLVGGLIASAVLDLQASGVTVVGPVPRGLPTPGVPSVDPGDLASLFGAGAALALVGLAEGLSAARLFAGRGGYRIDADQELLAAGAANVASGLFGGIGVAGSLSKTAAVHAARGRTQMAGLVAAGLSLVVIMVIAPVLSSLPRAVLSAIVVNAVAKLIDLPALRRYARVRRNDIVAAVVAAVGVVAFGPLNGLGRRCARRPVGHAAQARHRPLPGPGQAPGARGAAAVGVSCPSSARIICGTASRRVYGRRGARTGSRTSPGRTATPAAGSLRSRSPPATRRRRSTSSPAVPTRSTPSGRRNGQADPGTRAYRRGPGGPGGSGGPGDFPVPAGLTAS